MKNFRKRRKGFFANLSLTNILILVNVVLFFVFIFLTVSSSVFEFASGPENLISLIALKPSLILQGYVWTFFTSMFMHANFTHLFVNMVSLFFIGNFLERLIGKKRFLWFYLISGLVAGFFFVGFAYLGVSVSNGNVIFGGIDDFAVGASGALFGLGGLLAVLIMFITLLTSFSNLSLLKFSIVGVNESNSSGLISSLCKLSGISIRTGPGLPDSAI